MCLDIGIDFQTRSIFFNPMFFHCDRVWSVPRGSTCFC
uniref:Uncharacterized protein n=1 Tax=Vitis vinifera TaxID=29760 RepID=F6H8J9_VITVI